MRIPVKPTLWVVLGLVIAVCIFSSSEVTRWGAIIFGTVCYMSFTIMEVSEQANQRIEGRIERLEGGIQRLLDAQLSLHQQEALSELIRRNEATSTFVDDA